ncbi:NADP-dependent oxidoreductase [Apilactobacillus apinorum]|uniref:NADP-dependent oxidoreductase n=1 Tax=Apilactobacillus apinorum TaxID=1218495 RepID=A0ABP9ZHP8_9LACO|nr:NADP-dependent oxidoreductase [Apilactobacillus apinorum]KOY69912.1 Oxidoreductase [Apilactobacillus apinorum]CAI2608599.1 Oxidoreductase [Apilactobacillus apinorum]
MKAAELLEYSEKFKLQVVDIDIPEIKPSEVLIKVVAASVNDIDNEIGRGELKNIFDYKLPQILGSEVSGYIEKIGDDVEEFEIGDAVYTRLPIRQLGGFAEYVAVDMDYIAKAPKTLKLFQSSTVPFPALAAYQILVDRLTVEPGKTLFINGGSGSFGSGAIVIAKAMGLNVIVSGNRKFRNNAMILGADKYIDYKVLDYTQVVDRVDYVIDALGRDHFEDEMKILKTNGDLVSLNGIPDNAFAKRQKFGWLKKHKIKKMSANVESKSDEYRVKYHYVLSRENGKQLKKISEIIDKTDCIKKIKFERGVFKIEQINEALDYVKKHHTEKVIILF